MTLGTFITGCRTAWQLLFASCEMANRAAAIIPGLVHTTTFNLPRMKQLCDKNFMTATVRPAFVRAAHCMTLIRPVAQVESA